MEAQRKREKGKERQKRGNYVECKLREKEGKTAINYYGKGKKLEKKRKNQIKIRIT